MMNRQMRDMDNLMESMMGPFGMGGMMIPGFGGPGVGAGGGNPRSQMIDE